jgi:hypothetical protein
VRGGASGLARERAPRHGAVRFALENPRYRTRDARPAVGFALVLARGISVCGASARARLGLPFPWRAKGNACTPRFGQADGDGLLRRSRPMFAPADLAYLLVHELASLGGRCFPRPFVLASLRDYSLLRPVSFCDPIRRGAVALARAPVAYDVNACAINLIPPRRDRRSFRRGVFGVDARRETQMNILTVNLVFSTLVFAIAAKLYLIPMLPILRGGPTAAQQAEGARRPASDRLTSAQSALAQARDFDLSGQETQCMDAIARVKGLVH